MEMSTRRQQLESAAEGIARPIIADLGLELVEVTVTGPGRAPVVRFVIDRPEGGITVDELSQVSRDIETSLEVADLVAGRYHLEVSSPGLDRPLKTLRDFEKRLGGRVTIKVRQPLPGGQRVVHGRIEAVAGETIRVAAEGDAVLEIPFPEIASARPEVDWQALLRGEGTKDRPGHRRGERES
jgi:ribosome maturation factor RimP